MTEHEAPSGRARTAAEAATKDLFAVLHRPTRNVLGEYVTRAEAEQAIADWGDCAKAFDQPDEEYEIVEVEGA